MDVVVQRFGTDRQESLVLVDGSLFAQSAEPIRSLTSEFHLLTAGNHLPGKQLLKLAGVCCSRARTLSFLPSARTGRTVSTRIQVRTQGNMPIRARTRGRFPIE